MSALWLPERSPRPSFAATWSTRRRFAAQPDNAMCRLSPASAHWMFPLSPCDARVGRSCPYSATCPTSCWLRRAILPPPASVPTSHPETLQRRAFFVALRTECVPADYSSTDIANARAETHSRTASLRSLCAPALRHRPVSSSATSRRRVRPSAVPLRDLLARGWPSAPVRLPSLCSSASPSTCCDKNAPCTAATAFPGKTPRGS